MADNTSQIAGLFMTPELYQQQQDALAQARFDKLAQMSGRERADAALMGAGYQLAGGIGQALGAQDPMLQAISTRNQLAGQFDLNTAKGWAGLSNALRERGDLQGAAQAAQQSTALQAKIDEKQAALAQALAIADANRASREQMAAESRASREQMAADHNKLMITLAGMRQNPNKPLTTQDIKMANELTAAVKDADFGIAEATRFTDLIDKGALKFGVVENAMSSARSLAGKANESDLAKSDLEKWVTSSINAVLNQAKGVQAKDDAERAQKQVMAALDKNDPNLIRQGIQRIKKLLENTKDDAMSGLQLMSQERNRDLTGRIPSKAGTKENPIVLK